MDAMTEFQVFLIKREIGKLPDAQKAIVESCAQQIRDVAGREDGLGVFGLSLVAAELLAGTEIPGENSNKPPGFLVTIG